MNKIKKNNIVSFPTKLTDLEREIEAIVFAAAEPLSVETIESKLSKQTDIQQSQTRFLHQKCSNTAIFPDLARLSKSPYPSTDLSNDSRSASSLENSGSSLCLLSIRKNARQVELCKNKTSKTKQKTTQTKQQKQTKRKQQTKNKN